MANEIISSESPEFMTAKNASIFERLENALLKNIGAASRRIYNTDARQFLDWLEVNSFQIETISYEGLSEYRAHLEETFAKATASRKLVTARRLLDVAVILGVRTDNPAKQVKGWKSTGDNETTYRTLHLSEARVLLKAVDVNTNKGKRDYALLRLLMHTGMRRAEAAALTLGDIYQEQGYNIVVIRHGKGDKRRISKIPSEVMEAIENYLKATERKDLPSDKPLFVSFTKGDRPKEGFLNGLGIERMVKSYASLAGLKGLSPHGLRATFVTLALEGGAKLHQVQYAVGHADPRTTERYQRRKLNLQDNAADYVKI